MRDQSEVECVFGAKKWCFWDQMPLVKVLCREKGGSEAKFSRATVLCVCIPVLSPLWPPELAGGQQ